MHRLLVPATVLLLAGVVYAGPGVRPSEPIVGLPCEGCDLVFLGMPEQIPAQSRIAPVGEPGEPMRIEGTVRDAKGKPVSGVIVYAYHTDARGIYPRDDRLPGIRHGRLRGWATTDERGTYRFDTIRPAGYPNTGIPSHVHMHVIEPGRCTYYVDEMLFDDDPRLTSEDRRQSPGRGGKAITTPRKDPSGVWRLTRDIVLGENIPGYPRATRS